MAGINWNDMDILLSTPIILDSLMRIKEKYDPFDINPRIVVVDEADLLLSEASIRKGTFGILTRFSENNKLLAEQNKDK